MMIPEWVVSLFAFAAGVGCLAYTRTRYRREKRASWGWMAIPCFSGSFIYAWFYFFNVPGDKRVLPIRLMFISQYLLILIVTFTVSYMDKKKHPRNIPDDASSEPNA